MSCRLALQSSARLVSRQFRLLNSRGRLHPSPIPRRLYRSASTMSAAPAPDGAKQRSQSTPSAPSAKPVPEKPERSATTASVPKPTPDSKPGVGGKPDRSSLEYVKALATCLRWDYERNEPYLQLPSFPDLRLTPYRPGIAEDLVSARGIEMVIRVRRGEERGCARSTRRTEGVEPLQFRLCCSVVYVERCLDARN